jgi:Flp pilus assembly pilin Flp
MTRQTMTAEVRLVQPKQRVSKRLGAINMAVSTASSHAVRVYYFPRRPEGAILAPRPAWNRGMSDQSASSLGASNMLNLLNLVRSELITCLHGDEHGVVYVEYALLITLIALVIAGGASLLGNNINGLFTNLAGYIASVTTP